MSRRRPNQPTMELTSPEFRLVCAYDRRNKVLLQTASFFFLLQLYVLQGAFVAELAGVVSVTRKLASETARYDVMCVLHNEVATRLCIFQILQLADCFSSVSHGFCN